MKCNFSNLLAIASILVWATAWAATEKNAASSMKQVPASNADFAVGTLQASR